MRGDVVALPEAAYEVRNATVEQLRRVAEGDIADDSCVQVCPKPAGDGRLWFPDGGYAALEVAAGIAPRSVPAVPRHRAGRV